MLANPLCWEPARGSGMQLCQPKRRDFITLLGGAAVVWPLAARAQQPGMPAVDFPSTAPNAPFVAAFRQGLKESGFVESQKITIDFVGRKVERSKLKA
jgi:hypothetical protein